MRQTLFYIPNEIFGLPLIGPAGSNLGFGLLSAAVAIVGSTYLFLRIRRTGFDADARNNVIVLVAVCLGIVLIAPRLLDPAPDGSLGLPVRGYGVMLLLAVLTAVFAATRRAKQVGLHPDVILSVAFWAFIFGIAGARLLYIADHPNDFRGNTLGEILSDTLNVTQGGLVVYGGLLGGAVGFLIFSIKNKIMLLPFADIIAASLVIGQAIGRLGCLMNGCCFGGLCDLPYTAVTFPWGSPPHVHQVLTNETDLYGIYLDDKATSGGVVIGRVVEGSLADGAGLHAGEIVLAVDRIPVRNADEFARVMLADTKKIQEATEKGEETDRAIRLTVAGAVGSASDHVLAVPDPLPRSQPVYPTQIYGFINGILFFAFAWVLFPFRRRDGEVFASLLLLFPLTRFLLEVIRTDEPQNFFMGMTVSQTISVALSLCGAALWIYLVRQPERVAGPEIWQRVNARFLRTY